MRDLAEAVASWIYAVQITSPGQWLLRMLVLLSAGLASYLSTVWFPVPIASPLTWVAVALALWSAARPDSIAPLAWVLALVLWWLIGAAGAVWWQTLAVVAFVGLFHLTCAFAAAAPSYSSVTTRAGGRMARAAAAYLAAVLAAAGVMLGAVALPVPRGMWWVVVGAALLVAVTLAFVGALNHQRGGPRRG